MLCCCRPRKAAVSPVPQPVQAITVLSPSKLSLEGRNHSSPRLENGLHQSPIVVSRSESSLVNNDEIRSQIDEGELVRSTPSLVQQQEEEDRQSVTEQIRSAVSSPSSATSSLASIDSQPNARQEVVDESDHEKEEVDDEKEEVKENQQEDEGRKSQVVSPVPTEIDENENPIEIQTPETKSLGTPNSEVGSESSKTTETSGNTVESIIEEKPKRRIPRAIAFLSVKQLCLNCYQKLHTISNLNKHSNVCHLIKQSNMYKREYGFDHSKTRHDGDDGNEKEQKTNIKNNPNIRRRNVQKEKLEPELNETSLLNHVANSYEIEKFSKNLNKQAVDHNCLTVKAAKINSYSKINQYRGLQSKKKHQDGVCLIVPKFAGSLDDIIIADYNDPLFKKKQDQQIYKNRIKPMQKFTTTLTVKSGRSWSKKISRNSSKSGGRPPLFPSSLTPFENPKDGLLKTLLQMENPEWEVVMLGLQGLVRLCRHHTKMVTASSHSIVQSLVNNIRNLRSQVSRGSCQVAKELFDKIGRFLDAEVEDLAGTLLSKTADTNKFLRGDALAALESMVDHTNPVRSVAVLVNKGAKHQNALVRCSTARLLLRLAKKLGAERTLSLPRETKDSLVVTTAKLLMEGSLDTRQKPKKTKGSLVDLNVQKSDEKNFKAVNKD